ncbi:hypothetical protein MTR_5g011290 [Medicago truncatula]|uniref:Uncharacterized protein n=1 Tax=Medicago truncatula TaxID=3880 RepID=G7KEU4_MEDTR|nr:hypothetical protein MTR_5g011290 [Medicago truncatula]
MREKYKQQFDVERVLRSKILYNLWSTLHFIMTIQRGLKRKHVHKEENCSVPHVCHYIFVIWYQITELSLLSIIRSHCHRLQEPLLPPLLKRFRLKARPKCTLKFENDAI